MERRGGQLAAAPACFAARMIRVRAQIRPNGAPWFITRNCTGRTAMRLFPTPVVTMRFGYVPGTGESGGVIRNERDGASTTIR